MAAYPYEYTKNIDLCTSFFKEIIYLFLERGGEKERGRETSMCGCLSYTSPTGDLASNSGMCPDWESNQ